MSIFSLLINPAVKLAAVSSVPVAIHTSQSGKAHDVFAGDPFPNPWVRPGFQKIMWLQSPNWGERPAGTVVDTVVVHATAGPTARSAAMTFFNPSNQVSAHYIIGKDGSIYQCVSTFKRAWHAGASRDFLDRRNVNNFSIGIELVNMDDGKDPYPAAQTTALKHLIEALEYRFPLKYITSHAFIALPAGRKVDPNGFDWKTLAGIGLKFSVVGHAKQGP